MQMEIEEKTPTLSFSCHCAVMRRNRGRAEFLEGKRGDVADVRCGRVKGLSGTPPFTVLPQHGGEPHRLERVSS